MVGLGEAWLHNSPPIHRHWRPPRQAVCVVVIGKRLSMDDIELKNHCPTVDIPRPLLHTLKCVKTPYWCKYSTSSYVPGELARCGGMIESNRRCRQSVNNATMPR